MITSFYDAFSEGDYASMQACYHEDVEFSDPVFGELTGDSARAMWHMLCAAGSDLEVTYHDVAVSDSAANATWEAKYTLGGNDRLIHNVISASFELKDGKIYKHRDEFDLWKWSRMALGTPGLLLGWSGIVKGRVRERAKAQLERFIEQHPEYQ